MYGLGELKTGSRTLWLARCADEMARDAGPELAGSVRFQSVVCKYMHMQAQAQMASDLMSVASLLPCRAAASDRQGLRV